MSTENIRRSRGRQDTYYYHQRGIEVTNRCLTVGPDRYEVAELDDLMVTRGQRHRWLTVAAGTAMVESALIAPLVGVLRGSAIWLVGALAVGIAGAAGIVTALYWPPEYHLFARYRGRTVTLFTTQDEREFGQVCRALRRAVETIT
jgi:hypothetical protein